MNVVRNQTWRNSVRPLDVRITSLLLSDMSKRMPIDPFPDTFSLSLSNPSLICTSAQKKSLSFSFHHFFFSCLLVVTLPQVQASPSRYPLQQVREYKREEKKPRIFHGYIHPVWRWELGGPRVCAVPCAEVSETPRVFTNFYVSAELSSALETPRPFQCCTNWYCQLLRRIFKKQLLLCNLIPKLSDLSSLIRLFARAIRHPFF
jgi:hypothetical protein